LGIPGDGPSSVSGNVTHLEEGAGASRLPSHSSQNGS
jgi:hypothetical protein